MDIESALQEIPKWQAKIQLPKHYDLKVMQKIANGWVVSMKPPKAKRSEVAAAALRHEQTSKRKQAGGNDEGEGDATEGEDVHPVPVKKAKVAEDENVPRKEGRMEKSLPSGKKDTAKGKALEPTNTKAAKEKAAMEKAAKEKAVKEKAARVKAKKERDAAVEAEAKAKIAADELVEAEKLKAGKLKAGKPRAESPKPKSADKVKGAKSNTEKRTASGSSAAKTSKKRIPTTAETVTKEQDSDIEISSGEETIVDKNKKPEAEDEDEDGEGDGSEEVGDDSDKDKDKDDEDEESGKDEDEVMDVDDKESRKRVRYASKTEDDEGGIAPLKKAQDRKVKKGKSVVVDFIAANRPCNACLIASEVCMVPNSTDYKRHACERCKNKKIRCLRVAPREPVNHFNLTTAVGRAELKGINWILKSISPVPATADNDVAMRAVEGNGDVVEQGMMQILIL